MDFYVEAQQTIGRIKQIQDDTQYAIDQLAEGMVNA